MSGHEKKLVWAGSFAICRKASADRCMSDFTFRLLCTLSRFVCVTRFGAQCSFVQITDAVHSVVLAPVPPCRSGECFRRSGNPSLTSTGLGNLSCQHSLVVLWLRWKLFWKSDAGRLTADPTFSFSALNSSCELINYSVIGRISCASHILCCLHGECAAGTSRHHAKSSFQHCTNLSKKWHWLCTDLPGDIQTAFFLF